MKIKNESVSIKVGKKQYDFTNLILNEYFKRFINGQLETSANTNARGKKLNYILLKFEDELDINEDSTISLSDFDMYSFGLSNPKQMVYENQIIVEYQYELFGFQASLLFRDNSDISEHYGQKITAIGFNSWPTDSTTSSSMTLTVPVCAVLDTSSYDIYFQEGQDMAVSRKDIITSDAEFYSPFSKVTGPIHLMPYTPSIIDNGKMSCGILYSVGLSHEKKYMEKEYIINEDIEIQTSDTDITIEGLEEYFRNDIEQPKTSLYSGASLYARMENYKYILLKYKVWQYNEEYAWIDSGYYYYQIYPLNKLGRINFKINYERG